MQDDWERIKKDEQQRFEKIFKGITCSSKEEIKKCHLKTTLKIIVFFSIKRD
jgi:hypothetical protein